MDCFSFKKAIPVKLHAIESELVQLWKTAAGQHESEHAVELIKACSVNVIIYTTNEKAAEQIADTMTRIAAHHPSRAVFIIDKEADAKPGFDAWIRTHCTLQGDRRRQVCCEAIILWPHGETRHQVSNVVRSLLLPDVPAVLWWDAEVPLVDETFSRLSSFVDRVLIDSSKFKNPSQALKTLVKYVTGKERRISVRDLNWGRLTVWRELLAQLFDAPPIRVYLPRIRRIELEYAPGDPGSSSGPVRGFLLLGWLCVQLKWNPQVRRYANKNNTILFEMESDSGTISIVIKKTHERAGQNKGGLRAVVIAAHGTDVEARFSVVSREGEDFLRSSGEITGQAPIHRTIRIVDQEEADLVSRELEIFGHDATYEKVLAWIVQQKLPRV